MSTSDNQFVVATKRKDRKPRNKKLQVANNQSERSLANIDQLSEADKRLLAKFSKAQKPSIIRFRDAALGAAVNPENADLDLAGRNTMKNIIRRLNAMERNPTFKAENFGASDYDVSEHLDLVIPGSTLQDAAKIITRVINGEVLHPKRFGSRGESMVIKTIASKIIPIPTSGTGGFTTGDTIIVAQPVHTAYKGVVIYAVNATTGVFKVIGYAAPDRDPELISTACATLFSDLEISAPAAVTGTTVAVTSQLMLEMAKVNISPVSLVPGKVAPLAEGRKCPIRTIGPESHRLVNFTATDSENLVKRLSANDPLNPSLVRIPGDGDGLTTSSAPEVIAPFTFSCTGQSSEQLLSAGFSAATAAASGGLFSVTTAGATIWNLRDCSDFNRHMLYGDFEFSVSLHQNSLVSAHRLEFTVWTEYQAGDGNVSLISQYFETPDTSCSASFNFSTRGNSAFAIARGAIISNIYLALDVSANSTQISFVTERVPQINIRFLDVSARTAYLAAVISGAQSGYRVAVGSCVHTEIFLDPGALNSTFLSATDDLPYQPQYLPYLVRTHMQTAGHDTLLSAASFLKTMNKIGRIGGRVGSMALTGLESLNTLKTAAAPLMATSFGSSRVRCDGFSFPAITQTGDEAITAIIPITTSNYNDKMISKAFPTSPLGYGVPVDGRSATLALLLANLSRTGYQIKRGSYSGEVLNIDLQPNSVAFDLAPVDGEKQKVLGSADLGYKITGNFADGFFYKDKFTAFDPQNFSPHATGFERVESPPGYPGTTFRVTLQK